MQALAAAPKALPSIKQGRFSINLVANLCQLGLTLIVGVWYVPFLVKTLGPAAYGLIPLTSMITSYMGLITLGLDSAVARFLTIAVERKDDREANLVFNVSFWSNVALATILLGPAILLVVYADRVVRIPAGYETATQWLFAGTAAAFLLNQIKTPFSVSSFSRNRLELRNLASISETLTRVGLVVVLFALLAPSIEYVGAGILAGTVVSMAAVIWQWRALTPDLFIARQFDWSMFRNLLSTGGWVIVSQVGVMLYLNIDLLLANWMFGPEQSGRYAAVLQVPLLLRYFAIAVGGIFAPTMFHIYARGDFNGLVLYLNRAIKFLGYVMALSIGLICGFGEPLLRLWLGPAFGDMAPLMFLMVIHLCISLSLYPLYAVPLATNRVKVPGLVTLGVGVGNVLLALLFAGVFGWGLYGLAAAGTIMLTLRHLFFTPIYTARILNRTIGTFMPGLGPVILATLATLGLCRLILLRWGITNWLELGLAASAVSVLFVAVVYLLLSPSEKAALREAVARSREEAPGLS